VGNNLPRIWFDNVTWRLAASVTLAGLLALCAASGASAQDPGDPTKPQNGTPSQQPSAAPPPPAPDSAKKPAGKNKNSDVATSNAPDQPVWDPLRADKDIQVGHYYMDKGDVDAAIDRFEDAIVAKPGYAIPYRYLGEAQEKKGQKRLAAKSYQRYLDLYPHAEDAAKVRKKIEKLYKELEKDKS
jgi:tetratricopeptide (TPR) repeat protein